MFTFILGSQAVLPQSAQAADVSASFANLTELTVAGNIKVYYDPNTGD